MGSVKKIGSTYVIEFLARGLRYQQKAGPDKKKAEELLQSIEEKIAKGEMALMVRDLDYDIFFHDFLKALPQEFPPKTVARFRRAVRYFENFLRSDCKDAVRLSHITPRVMEQYRAFLLKAPKEKSPQAAAKSVNLTLFLLRHVFDGAIKMGHLNDNPLLHTRFVADPLAKKPDTLDPEALDAILKNLPGPVSLAAEFILLTGLDIRELCRLKWKDIDFGEKILKIPRSGKPAPGLVHRDIPLQPKAEDILKKLRAHGAGLSSFVFADSKGRGYKSSFLIQELQDVTHHQKTETPVSFLCFRNLFALELVQRGATLITLQKILGHADIAETLMYAPFVFEHSLNGTYQVSGKGTGH